MGVEVAIPELHRLVVARLSQRFARDDAEQMADVVLFGELAGRPSHGISRVLPGRYGAVDEEPGPPPTIERTGPGAGRVTGRPGILLAIHATDLLIEIASEHGLGIVTTTGSSSTSGSLTYYLDKLASADLVAMVCANTLAYVTAPGGKARILGTNPFAIVVPTTGYPLIHDISTAATTFGHLAEARMNGQPIPEGVAVDAWGEPTTDPSSVIEGGALLPFGGHKGLGLAMATELLSGILTGSACAPVEQGDVWGHVFVGISLSAVGDPDELRGEAQAAVERIRSTPTKDGTPVRIPGERSLQARDAALVAGKVEVDGEVLRELIDLVGA